MAITDMPVISMLRDRMQWHQARQKVLAENVANANTPGFQPRDLREGPAAGQGARPPGGAAVAMARTHALHLAVASSVEPDAKPANRFETKPSGNAVTLEDEMLKVADNQSEYQLAASLYSKSLAMLRSAAGVRGA